MKKILILFGILLPIITIAQVAEVSVEEAQDLFAEGAILVDIREKDEVAELAYISEGMMHIPLSELAGRFKELPQDKTLIIACRSGNRSKTAINQLNELGVGNTLNLEGGIKAWQGKGYPVIVNGKAPVKKACCSKAGAEGKSCCSGKTGNKSCGSKAGKSSCNHGTKS